MINLTVLKHLAIRAHVRLKVAAALALLLLLVTGCQHARRPGFPKQSIDPKGVIKELEDNFRLSDKIKAYYSDQNAMTANGSRSLTSAQKEALRARRDEIISSRLALINLHYNQFIADASFNQQMFDLSADILDLGVDLATTAVGGAGAKTILGAVSAGISGAQTAIHKNLMYEKTVSALVAAMNASRKEALIPVAQGLRKDIDGYSLADALTDIDAYYFAGTFLGALNSIQKEAGENEANADEDLATIREVSFVSDTEGESIRSFWQPIDSANQAGILGWISTSPVRDASIETLIDSDGAAFVTARNDIVTALAIPIPAGAAALPLDLQKRVALRAFWRPTDLNAQQQIETWLTSNGLSGVPIETFISGGAFKMQRNEMMKTLGIQSIK